MEGVSSIFDFFSRYREPQLNIPILFAKGKASEILNITPQLETLTSEEVRKQERRGAGLEVKLRDFLTRMLAVGEEPFASHISSETLEKEGDASKMVPSLNGAAIFRGDKLVGWMDAKESRGLLWMRNEFIAGVISLKVPDDEGGEILEQKYGK